MISSPRHFWGAFVFISLTFYRVYSTTALFGECKKFQIPENWWNETVRDVRTLLSCSLLCQSEMCLGFSWAKEPDYVCTIWNTEENRGIILGTFNNTISVWLKNGKHGIASTMVFFSLVTGSFTDYVQDGNADFPQMVIPDLLDFNGEDIVHQSFDWGLIICGISNKICSQWIYGSNSWSRINSLQKEHAHAKDQIGLINNALWMIGGAHSGTRESYTEYLNLAVGQWILGPNLPQYRHLFGISPIKDSFVLMAGGSNGSFWESEIQKYDVTQGTWKTVGNFNVGTVRSACEKHILSNGTAIVLCVGGEFRPEQYVYEKTAQTGVYNIETAAWTMVPEWDLPVACTHPKLQAVDGKLYLFGGGFADGKSNRVLEFKEGQNPAWQEQASMPLDQGYIIPLKFGIWYPSLD